MPINGKIAAWDKLEFQCQSSASGSGSAFSHEAELQTVWTPDSIDVSIGFQLQVGSQQNSDGTASWYANYNGPDAPSGGQNFGGATFESSINLQIFVNSVKVYATTVPTFIFEFTSIDVYLNGAFQVTLGPAQQYTSGAFGPSWIPQFCGLAYMFGNCTAASDAAISSSVSGGWQYEIGGTWYPLPVAIPGLALEPPLYGYSNDRPPVEVTAPYGLSYESTVLSGSTYGNQLSLNVVGSPNFSPGFWSESQGSVGLIPNLSREIIRMNPDYGASIFAWAMPEIVISGARQMTNTTSANPPVRSAVSHVGADVFSYTPAIAFEAGATAGANESFLSATIYSIVSGSVAEGTNGNGNPEAVRAEVLTWQFPSYVEQATSTNGIAPYMSHADLNVRYFNSAACHSMWHIGLVPGDWNLDGGAVPWTSYWGPIREQYLAHQMRRNFLVSEPAENGAFLGFLDYFFNNGSQASGIRWLGVSRFQVQKSLPPASITPGASSGSLFTVPVGSASLSFGTAITITPGSLSFTVRFSPYQYAESPYMFAAICNQIAAAWSGANIVSVNMHAVSGDAASTSVLIGNVSGTTYPLPTGADASYAGSWGIDNGAGQIVDAGVDSLSNGQSAAFMTSSVNSTIFQYLFENSFKYIDFEFVVGATGTNVTLDYPILYSDQNSPVILNESGQCAAVIYPNGQCVRLGNNAWATNPPTVEALGYKQNVVDFLSDKRVLLFGVDPVSGLVGGNGLAAECALLYDAFEGNSPGQVADNSISLTFGFNSGFLSMLINTVSEPPPILGFPSGGFDGNFNSTAPLSNQVYSLCQMNRYLISRSVQADLFSPSGVQATALSNIFVPGWKVTAHTQVVTNAEPNTWEIKSGGVQYASSRPWHGFSMVLESKSGGSPSVYETDTGEYHLAFIDGNGNINYNVSYDSHANFAVQTVVTTSGNWSVPSMCRDARERIELRGIYFNGTSYGSYQFFSDDDGRSFQNAAGTLILMSATQCRIATAQDGTILEMNLVPLSGSSGPGTFSARIRHAGDPNFSAFFTPTMSTGANLESDGSGFDITAAKEGPDRWNLAMVENGDTVISTWYSFDEAASFIRAI